MSHWADSAKCKGDPNPGRWFTGKPQDVLDCQDICALCPVRNGCGAAAMAEEADHDEASRFGFRAYMTPAQRVAIHRLGGLRNRDPMKVVLGMGVSSKMSQARTKRGKLPPIPEQGINWNRAHTALARKLMRHVGEKVKTGAYLPPDDKLCKLLGCSPERLHVVLDALLQSGMLIEPKPGRFLATTEPYVEQGVPC